MDEVIERLAGGDVLSSDRTDHLMLIMLARILMTQMAIAEAIAGMESPAEETMYEADKAGWGGLDG